MSEAVAQSIEALLARARGARAAHDVPGALAALREAQEASEALDVAHPLVARTAWRRAKAAFDVGATDEMLACLERVLTLEAPFADHPQGLRAVEPIARRWWDERGYGDARIPALWQAFVAAWRDGGDPWLAASGEAQLAWEWACSGELERLRQRLVVLGGMGPRDFGDGPTKHPRAADAPSSVWFAQMDLARTALRAAVWARDEALAREAHEVYADALAEAELDEDADHWFLETAGRAERTFGWRGDLAERWLASAVRLEHPRARLHRALAEGVGNGWPSALVQVLDAADAAGPEWGVDLRLEIGAMGDDPDGVHLAEARRIAAERGVGVFRSRLRDPG